MNANDKNERPRLFGTIVDGAFSAESSGIDAFDFEHGSSRIVGYGSFRLKIHGRWVDSSHPNFGQQLIQCWQAKGEDLPESLDGDFVIAAWDRESLASLVCVDRFATHSLYWGKHRGATAFSTRPVHVCRLLQTEPRINHDALFSYLYFHVIPAPLSVCRDVQRLDVASGLLVRAGQVTETRYWRPSFQERTSFDFGRERDQFFASVREGIEASCGRYETDQVGSFLSGGTDSSTIAGMLTEVTGKPAKTFSIVFGQEKYDERIYSRCAAKHFKTDHTEHQLTPDETEAAISSMATSWEQPFGNSSAIPVFVCADLAKNNGVKRLLGGDGGDELFGGNSRYATAWLFSHYMKVPEKLRTGVIEPIMVDGLLKGSGLWPARKIRGYVEQARVPLPDQLDARYNLLNRLGPENIFTDKFLQQINLDCPTDHQRQVWKDGSDKIALINQLLSYDFKFTLGDNDLPKVTRMCHEAGVSVGFPFLSRAMVEFASTLPANQKLHRLHLRRFFKKALRGYLPDLILDKSKHGFGMPFGDWLLTQPNLSRLAFRALDSLVSRGVLNSVFVNDIRLRLSEGHAGYYGTIVWVLMMLELWLQNSPFEEIGW